MSAVARARPVAVFALLSGTALLWLFRRVLFGGETFVENDLFAFHRPLKQLLLRLVAQSDGFPGWNPYTASGQPFAANPQHALLHPLTVLFYLLPFEWAFRLQVLLPLAAAAPAMFALARSQGRSRWASGFAGLAFGLGGPLLSAAHLLPSLFALAALPLLPAAVALVLRRGDALAVAALAAATGLLGLAGEPATLVVAPFLVLVAACRAPGGVHGRAPRVLLGLALGAGVAAGALLPAAALATRSVRAEGISRYGELWSLHPARLLEGFVPSPFEGWPGSDLWLHPGSPKPFMYSLYPGLLVTLLAGAALARAAARPRRGASRRTLAFAAFAAALLVLALGQRALVWTMLQRAPPFSGLRYPERFALLAMPALVLLSARGFDLVRRCPALRARVRFTSAVLCALAVAAALAARREWLPAATYSGCLRAALVALAAAALLSGRLTQRAPACLLAGLAFDLLGSGERLLTTRPAELLTQVPAVARTLLAVQPRTAVFNAAGWMRLRGETFERHLLRPPLPAGFGLATVFEPDFDLSELRFSAEATSMFTELLQRQPRTAFSVVRRRGAGALIRLRDDVVVEQGRVANLAAVDQLIDVRLLDHAAGAAFCAERVVAARGPRGWLEAVLALGPGSARAVVADPGVAPGLPAAPAPGGVRTLKAGPTRFVFEVDAVGPGPCLLAFNQTWDDYWQARVDGQPAVLWRTDLSLAALAVPRGRHHVELRYEDPWSWAGRAVSVSGLTGLVALLVVARRRSRPVGQLRV